MCSFPARIKYRLFVAILSTRSTRLCISSYRSYGFCTDENPVSFVKCLLFVLHVSLVRRKYISIYDLMHCTTSIWPPIHMDAYRHQPGARFMQLSAPQRKCEKDAINSKTHNTLHNRTERESKMKSRSMCLFSRIQNYPFWHAGIFGTLLSCSTCVSVVSENDRGKKKPRKPKFCLAVFLSRAVCICFSVEAFVFIFASLVGPRVNILQ